MCALQDHTSGQLSNVWQHWGIPRETGFFAERLLDLNRSLPDKSWGAAFPKSPRPTEPFVGRASCRLHLGGMEVALRPSLSGQTPQGSGADHHAACLATRMLAPRPGLHLNARCEGPRGVYEGLCGGHSTWKEAVLQPPVPTELTKGVAVKAPGSPPPPPLGSWAHVATGNPSSLPTGSSQGSPIQANGSTGTMPQAVHSGQWPP